MRMSCNGCRVLRKGCSENCSIRPCLQWIKSSESQSNATVFLAKFYGRAGLMNLINAGPDHLRPAIFKSLLYEACGRIVNPIYGSVGLLWSGNWQLCQEAVESVLRGTPIIPIASDSAACTNPPPIKDYDIRHVIKDDHDSSASPTAASGGKKDLRRVHNSSNRSRFKKSGGSSTKNPRHSKESAAAAACFESAAAACLASMMSNREWGMNSHNNNNDDNNNHRSMSHDSSTLSHGGCGDTTDQSMGSSHTAAHDPLPIFVVAAGDNLDMEVGGGTVRGSYNDGSDDEEKKDGELELELTLGFHQPVQARRSTS